MDRPEPVRWTISVVQDFEAAQETWVATIAELPDFRATCRTQEEGFAALVDHMERLRKTGSETDPAMIEYILSPTLEGYVRCRRLGFELDYPSFGGSEALGKTDQILSEFGITEREFIGILDADEDIIRDLSLRLIENGCNQRALKKSGQTHLAGRRVVIPDEVVDWLICAMLDGIRWNRIVEIPTDLIVLIRSRLIPGNSNIQEKIQILQSKQRAAWIAGSLLARGQQPSFRKCATLMRVQPSTVKRWFESESEFQIEAQIWAHVFDKDGNRKPLCLIGREVLRKK